MTEVTLTDCFLVYIMIIIHLLLLILLVVGGAGASHSIIGGEGVVTLYHLHSPGEPTYYRHGENIQTPHRNILTQFLPQGSALPSVY